MNRAYVYGSLIRTSDDPGDAQTRHLIREVKKLFDQSEGRRYQKGEEVYRPGDIDDCLYYIESGVVKLAYLDQSGRKLTLSILGKDDIFGEMVLVGKPERELLAQVLQDAVIFSIDKGRFTELLRSQPDLALEVMDLFGRRTREIESKLEDLVFKDIPTRLSRQILKLIEEHGVDTGDGKRIDFKITHKELADLIGSARENTTSALNSLAKEGILDKKRYQIIVKDEDRLKERGGSEGS